MAHTFNPLGTPGYPGAPHPTPSSNFKQQSHRFNPKIPRPPVQNPFDKFSQNDFDAWIGKLTGDLQKALGYEEVEQPQVSSPLALVDQRATESAQGKEDDYLEADSYVEDSFAEVKARRVLDKGKARDPREGPGLGPKYGDKDQPIEIVSEGEEEEEEEEEDQILEFEGSDAEGEVEEGEEEYEEAEESEQEVYEAGQSTRVRDDWGRKPRRIETDIDEDEMEEIELVRPDDEEFEQEEEEGESEDEGYEEGYEEEGGKQSSEEVIELLSDGEPGPSVANQHREEEEEFLSDEEHADARSPPAQFDGAFEATEEQDVLEAQEDDEMQPSDDDTSFPPHSAYKPEVSSLVDIRDPWAQVQRYAEDYYAGGEVIPGSGGPLTAHRLGANDDGSGFLTPDVANAELEKEDQDFEAEEEEFGDEEGAGGAEGAEDDEERESEAEDFDENDHLFNRLRPQIVSDLRGQPLHMVSNVKMSGHGTTEEPIMIESDDESEAKLPVREPEVQEEKEGEGEGDELIDERPEEQPTFDVKVEGQLAIVEAIKEEIPGATLVIEEAHEEETVPFKEAEILEEEKRPQPLEQQLEQGAPEESQPTTFPMVAASIETTEHPVSESEIPSLPDISPPQTSKPHGGEIGASETTGATTVLYDNTKIPTVVHDSRDTQKESHTTTQSIKSLVDWDLNFPSGFQRQAHEPTSSSASSLAHLAVPSAISGLLHAAGSLTTSNANVDAGVFGREEVVTQFGVDAHQIVHEQVQTQVHTSGRSVVVEEVVDDGEDELDEFERPGAFPLMTSDLEYPVEGELEEEDITSETPRASTPKQTEEPMMAEGYVKPSEVIEVEDNGRRNQESDVKIFVEEPEEYDTGTPSEEIVINVEAATPLPQSQSVSPILEEAHFEESAASPKLEVEPEIEVNEVSESTSAPMNVSLLSQEITREGETDVVPVVIHEGESQADVSQESVAEPAVEVKDADVTITVEQEDVTYPQEYVSFEESFAYTVEEPPTDSEYRASEGLERDVSIGIASVQSDEVIPPVIAKGDVEEATSDAEPEPEQEGNQSAVLGTQTTVVEEADVKDTQSTDQIRDEVREAETTEIEEVIAAAPVPVETHSTPTPPLEINDDDYFTQPGSPVMAPALTIPSQTNLPVTPNGTLPSIIQLPGAPQRVLSPVSTPGPGPTPVSIPVEPAVLKALKTNPDFLNGLLSPPVAPASQTQQPSTTATTLNRVDDAIPQQQQSTTIIPLLSAVTAPVYSLPESSGQSSTNGVPTSFPATTVVRQPTLFADPYPYSLSTPGPQIVEPAEEGSEEETEPDNSMTSSSSAEKESDEAIFNNAVDLKLHYPPAESTEPTTAASGVEVEKVVEKVLEVERGLVDVEAEANALIDEYLVDDPESDTDADGEADPEFVDLESSVSARASEERAVKNVEEVVARKNKMEVKASQEESAKETEVSKKTDEALKEKGSREATTKEVEEVEQDPFKLMGNDSMVAPGEAPDATLSDGSSGEARSEVEGDAIEHTPSQREPTNERSLESSQGSPAAVASILSHVEAVPVSYSRLPVVLGDVPGATGYVGVVPYQDAAAAYMSSRSQPAPQRRVQAATLDLFLLNQVTAPVYSLQQREQQETTTTLSPERTKGATQNTPLAGASQDVEQQETFRPVSESKAEASPRKVHVSVEDPYNADNDSDREHGSNASRRRKRKRSLSDVSNNELPSIASKSVSANKGRGKTTSTRSTKASRPRKEGNKKTTSRNVFGGPWTASRSPSVASTILSETSSLIQPSPTHLPLPSSEPRPFLHAHSRRKRGSIPTTVQEQLQKQMPPPGSHSQSGILRAEDVLTKAPSISSTSTSSPVTRSHCRYHLISIPKTENGPRIKFLVPGCSLNDENLIREEEIKDLGEAIITGDTHIVDNIETLDFDPYLLWVMRQLVGTEILRENEVFYLPEPGEEVVRIPPEPEKKKGSKSSKKRSKLAKENPANSPRDSTTGHSPSRGSSIASSASVLQQIVGESEIEYPSTLTETEDDKSSPPKPAKDVAAEGTNGLNGSPLKGEVLRPSRKRGRRLGQDAAAYHPPTDDEVSSDHSSHNPSRKGTRNRGVKRPRGSEANMAEVTNSRKVKKAKTQMSQSHPQIPSNDSQSQTQSGQSRLQTQPSQLPLTETRSRVSDEMSNDV